MKWQLHQCAKEKISIYDRQQVSSQWISLHKFRAENWNMADDEFECNRWKLLNLIFRLAEVPYKNLNFNYWHANCQRTRKAESKISKKTVEMNFNDLFTATILSLFLLLICECISVEFESKKNTKEQKSKKNQWSPNAIANTNAFNHTNFCKCKKIRFKLRVSLNCIIIGDFIHFSVLFVALSQFKWYGFHLL